MLNNSDWQELEKHPKESTEALQNRLAELRARGANMIECIKYVRLNQACELNQASLIVANSSAWADQRADFLHQQEEVFWEFVGYMGDKIKAIEQTITPDGESYTVHIKEPE